MVNVCHNFQSIGVAKLGGNERKMTNTSVSCKKLIQLVITISITCSKTSLKRSNKQKPEWQKGEYSMRRLFIYFSDGRENRFINTEERIKNYLGPV